MIMAKYLSQFLVNSRSSSKERVPVECAIMVNSVIGGDPLTLMPLLMPKTFTELFQLTSEPTLRD